MKISRRALPVALALLALARPAPAQERIHRTYTAHPRPCPPGQGLSSSPAQCPVP